MNQVTRRYSFAAAHRLEGHPKCGRLHGHNYDVTVTLAADRLYDGMVVDYGLMDEVIKPIIDTFDHRYVVSRENRDAVDPYAEVALRHGHAVDLPASRSTAENMAGYFATLIQVNLPKLVAEEEDSSPRVRLVSVQVDESPKSTATFYVE